MNNAAMPEIIRDTAALIRSAFGQLSNNSIGAPMSSLQGETDALGVPNQLIKNWMPFRNLFKSSQDVGLEKLLGQMLQRQRFIISRGRDADQIQVRNHKNILSSQTVRVKNFDE